MACILTSPIDSNIDEKIRRADPDPSNLTEHYYDSSALYRAAGGTALTVAAMGSFGFATSRDLIRWMRPLFWALLAVFGLSLVLILVGSGEHLVLNLAIYAIVSAYLAIYFQIIRRRATEHDVVWIATGVFISIVNIFLTLLRIFGNSR
jgi:modulator of FtsH protease